MRKLKMLLLSVAMASAGFVAAAPPAHASCDGPLEIDPCPVIEFCKKVTKDKLCS